MKKLIYLPAFSLLPSDMLFAQAAPDRLAFQYLKGPVKSIQIKNINEF